MGVPVGIEVGVGGMGVTVLIVVGVGGMGVTVVAGVGAVHAARMVIENKILNISRTVLRLMIPPFDLGIPQIIHRNNTTRISDTL
jgi:hypothetical protein